jgi:hypothetical protein
VVLISHFPPSKAFENYLRAFIYASRRNHDPSGSSGPPPPLPPPEALSSRIESMEDPRILHMIHFCCKRLDRICRSGPRGKVPSIQEIERARVCAFCLAG